MLKLKNGVLPLILPLLIGVVVLLNVWDNPRLQSAHGVDFFRLMVVGFCFGTVFGMVMAGSVFSQASKTDLPI